MRRRSKHRNIDVISHGNVLISDGHGRGRPARLQLSTDALTILVVEEPANVDSGPVETGATRTVIIRRQTDTGGLGLSLKGGVDVAPQMPVLISNVHKVSIGEFSLSFIIDSSS